jgi:hypothetical protein
MRKLDYFKKKKKKKLTARGAHRRPDAYTGDKHSTYACHSHRWKARKTAVPTVKKINTLRHKMTASPKFSQKTPKKKKKKKKKKDARHEGARAQHTLVQKGKKRQKKKATKPGVPSAAFLDAVCPRPDDNRLPRGRAGEARAPVGGRWWPRRRHICLIDCFFLIL